MTEEQTLIRLLEQSPAPLRQGDVRDLPALSGGLGNLLDWAEDRMRSIENRHQSIR